jgi:hypothetical protein
MSYLEIARAGLDELAEKDFAYGDGTKPGRFRFLDCKRYIDEKLICIQEFTELPESQYAAISYVWRGLKAQQNDFSCTDPISFSLLHTICVATLYFKCPLLWLDRLSIIQTSKEDKTWQIKNMFDLYQKCKVCLVLPGGLARLASLTEGTPWIHRAWTLQESLAPPSVQVLYQWAWGNCYLQNNETVEILEVVPQRAAATSLVMLLRACMKFSTIRFGGPSDPGPEVCTTVPESLRAAVLSDEEWSDYVIGLLGKSKKIRPTILSDGDEDGGVHRLNTLLGALTQGPNEGRSNAIWRSALLRTSSRPVDMVLSIMGLLGAKLNPASFAPEDRQKATIQLVKQLLQRGFRAEWLGVAPQVRIPAGLSTTPMMPQTSVAGRAYLESFQGRKEVSVMLGNNFLDTWWWLDRSPKGSMDDSGILKIRAKAMAVEQVEKSPADIYRSNHGPAQSNCNIIDDCANQQGWSLQSSASSGHFAVEIGQRTAYKHGLVAKIYIPHTTLLMVLGPCSNKAVSGFKIMGYAWADTLIAKRWHKKDFNIYP